MEVVKQEDQIFLKHKRKFYGYCHYCHKFGHRDADCKTKGKDQCMESNKQGNRMPPRRVSQKRLWRRKSDYKDSEETQI